eukprot:scaffold44825_cov67-Phaeocystis_antarctica.AAC.4
MTHRARNRECRRAGEEEREHQRLCHRNEGVLFGHGANRNSSVCKHSKSAPKGNNEANYAVAKSEFTL